MKNTKGLIVIDVPTLLSARDLSPSFASILFDLLKYNTIVIFAPTEELRREAEDVIIDLQQRGGRLLNLQMRETFPPKYDYIVSIFSVICMDAPGGFNGVQKIISKLTNKKYDKEQ